MRPEEHIAKYSTANDRRLKKVTEPLMIYGIDTFFSYSVSEDGYFTYLSNAGSKGEHFFEQDYYKVHPFFRTPKFIKNGVFMPDCEENMCENQQQQNEDVNANHLMFMGNKVGDTYYGYGFATTKDIPDLEKVYIKKLFLLKKFVNYFLKETKDLIIETNENKVLIAPYIGERFYKPKDIYTEERDRLFLDKILKSRPLSSQEQACVRWLVRGKTARQIGEALGLSKRTVEHYLENVKDKWDCYSKQEIIEQAFMHDEILSF